MVCGEKITVVTVCRNSLSLLQKTVGSVLAQTYPQLEYIIIDGASDDGTTDFLQHCSDARLRWFSEPDNGIYDAMNKGVAQATGSWTIFMNAGDTFFHNDTISQMFAHQPTADVIYGDVYKEGKGTLRAETPHNAHRMYFCHQSAFIRTDCLRRLPYDTNHPYSADFKFFKQLFLDGASFEQVALTIAVFDTTGVSNTNRAAGIADNISVIRETDTPLWQCRLLPRLYFQLLMCKLRR